MTFGERGLLDINLQTFREQRGGFLLQAEGSSWECLRKGIFKWNDGRDSVHDRLHGLYYRLR